MRFRRAGAALARSGSCDTRVRAAPSPFLRAAHPRSLALSPPLRRRLPVRNAQHKESVVSVVLFLAQSVEVVGNQEWNLLILEMTHLIFRGIDPAGLAAKPVRHGGAPARAAKSKSAAAAQQQSRDPLVAMRRAENEKRRGVRSRRSRRHSHFGGTFKASVGIDHTGQKKRFVMLSHPNADPAAALAKLQPARRRQGGRKAEDLADSRAAMRAMGRRDGDALHGSAGVNAKLDCVPGLRDALRTTLASFVQHGFKPLAQSVFKEIMKKSSKLIESDTRQFIALVWNALRFYQAFSAEEGAWVREQMSKLELLGTAAGKSRRGAIESELRARGKVRGEMAQQVQFCMTETRLWEFVTRKTQMYAGLDESKMEHNWGSVASAAALLREMLTLLRGERENALRAAAKAQKDAARENLSATALKKAEAKAARSIKMAETVDKLVQAMFYQVRLLHLARPSVVVSPRAVLACALCRVPPRRVFSPRPRAHAVLSLSLSLALSRPLALALSTSLPLSHALSATYSKWFPRSSPSGTRSAGASSSSATSSSRATRCCR